MNKMTATENNDNVEFINAYRQLLEEQNRKDHKVMSVVGNVKERSSEFVKEASTKIAVHQLSKMLHEQGPKDRKAMNNVKEQMKAMKDASAKMAGTASEKSGNAAKAFTTKMSDARAKVDVHKTMTTVRSVKFRSPVTVSEIKTDKASAKKDRLTKWMKKQAAN